MSASDNLSEDQFHIVHKRVDPHSGVQQGRVRAYTKVGNGLVSAGSLHYHVNEGFFDRKATYPDDIHVAEPFRRQGVASRLYGEAVAKTGHPIVHDPEAMTPEAVKAVDRDAAKNPGRHLRWDGKKTTPWEAS